MVPVPGRTLPRAAIYPLQPTIRSSSPLCVSHSRAMNCWMPFRKLRAGEASETAGEVAAARRLDRCPAAAAGAAWCVIFDAPLCRLGLRRSSLQGPCAELDLEMQILAAGISQLTA